MTRIETAPSDRPVVRAVELDDAAGLAALMSLPGVQAGTLQLPHRSADDVRAWLQNRICARVSDDALLVASLGGEIVGWAGLNRRNGRRSHAAGVGLGVHDAHRRRGIGRALLDALIDRADNWLGLTRLDLSVYVDNAAAIALYEAHGFEIEGRARAEALRDGRLVDAYSMARLKAPPHWDPNQV